MSKKLHASARQGRWNHTAWSRLASVWVPHDAEAERAERRPGHVGEVRQHAGVDRRIVRQWLPGTEPAATRRLDTSRPLAARSRRALGCRRGRAPRILRSPGASEHRAPSATGSSSPSSGAWNEHVMRNVSLPSTRLVTVAEAERASVAHTVDDVGRLRPRARSGGGSSRAASAIRARRVPSASRRAMPARPPCPPKVRSPSHQFGLVVVKVGRPSPSTPEARAVRASTRSATVAENDFGFFGVVKLHGAPPPSAARRPLS